MLILIIGDASVGVAAGALRFSIDSHGATGCTKLEMLAHAHKSHQSYLVLGGKIGILRNARWRYTGLSGNIHLMMEQHSFGYFAAII